MVRIRVSYNDYRLRSWSVIRVKIKVIVADDNSFVREGLKIILSSFPEFEVLTTVGNGQEAVTYCRQHAVDVALLDVRMPIMNGVEATRLLVETTTTKPLILTTFNEDEYVQDAVRFGAKGYLLKNNDPEYIRDAIRTVSNGHLVLQDAVADKLKNQWVPHSGKQADGRIDKGPFTEREWGIMTLIAEGYTNKEIAGQMHISEGTVANHITSILGKTGLQHRTQIAIYYWTGKRMK
ncbi:response regulator [Paenibacillaceae bacterium WGS1546]|uniref:response regulator transcription factor n=1 Tax=Cohnella sp. WGS1546 TaxID=3366810 RepID=UPI00372D1C48